MNLDILIKLTSYRKYANFLMMLSVFKGKITTFLEDLKSKTQQSISDIK